LIGSPKQGRTVDRVAFEPLFEKKQKDSSRELPQVETASGQDDVDLVADFTLEEVAVRTNSILVS
jgi:hypothetical protein